MTPPSDWPRNPSGSPRSSRRPVAVHVEAAGEQVREREQVDRRLPEVVPEGVEVVEVEEVEEVAARAVLGRRDADQRESGGGEVGGELRDDRVVAAEAVLDDDGGEGRRSAWQREQELDRHLGRLVAAVEEARREASVLAVVGRREAPAHHRADG